MVLLRLLIFIVWETEDDRPRFYKQTVGFGFMSDHMTKPPSVFLFGEGLYDELGSTPDWTVDVITSENAEIAQFLNGHLFVAQQERHVIVELYDGNDFDSATIALIKTVGLEQEDTRHGLQWKRYAIELHRCEQTRCPGLTTVEAPKNIAELVREEPWSMVCCLLLSRGTQIQHIP